MKSSGGLLSSRGPEAGGLKLSSTRVGGVPSAGGVIRGGGGAPEGGGSASGAWRGTSRMRQCCSLAAWLCLLLGFQLGSISSTLLASQEPPIKQHGEEEGEGRVVREVRLLLQRQEEQIRNLTRQTEEMRAAMGMGGGEQELGRGHLEAGRGSECNSQGWTSKAGSVYWNPKPNRFLLAMCSGGQLSNRLACFRQNMLDAALMNRTLILPTKGIDYNYDQLLDLTAMDVCFGPNRVIRLDDYSKKVDGRVRVGRMVCHVHTYQTEEVCEQLARRYHETLGIDFAKRDIAKRRTPGPWFKYPVADFLKKFNSDHHVVAFANSFGVGGRDLPFHGPMPLSVSERCSGFLQPSPIIKETAVGFVNTYLGRHFVALHLRRGDFFAHCLKGNGRKRKSPCYHPLTQIARCLHRRLQSLSLAGRGIFLATNADTSEMLLLRDSLLSLGHKEPLIRLGEMKSQGWAEPLVKSGLSGNAEVLSFVDKTICALSSRFLGTAGSTFTHDIMRMREWWYSGLICDTYICPANDASEAIPFDINQSEPLNNTINEAKDTTSATNVSASVVLKPKLKATTGAKKK